MRGTMNVYLHTANGATIIESQSFTRSNLMQVMKNCSDVAVQASCNNQKTSVGVKETCGTFYLDGEKLMTVMEG